MRVVLDSNVLLYAVDGALAAPLPQGDYFVSVLTRIEVLSFPGLSKADERVIGSFLEGTTVVGIEPKIEAETIRLRKRTRLRMADAVIAATAIAIGAELYTHDTNLLKVSGLNATAPALK